MRTGKRNKIENSYLLRALQNLNKFENLLKGKPEKFWMRRGQFMLRKLYTEKVKRVPAYKQFLISRGFKLDKSIKFIDNRFPLLDKPTYLRKYGLEDLCWDGSLVKMRGTISSTSGSTGIPFYFPRSSEQDLMYSLTAQMYLKNNFNCDRKSTLYICAFPMGPWIGGVFTYEAVKRIVDRTGWDISIITTSINKAEVINALKNFGNKYQQVIIGAYGPFLKDFLEDAKDEGVDLEGMNISFIFSAEGFSEYFRQYVYELVADTNQKDFSYYRRSLNHYGTVDQGTLSYETPICILLRKLAIDNIPFYNELFGVRHKLPTFTQYIPEHFYFEEGKGDDGKNNGQIICSSFSGLPLFKYDLKDNGGVRGFELVNGLCKKYLQKDIKTLARENGIIDTLWQIPFVFVYERADFSVSLYAFQVYPETIRKALQRDKKLYARITGKFTMISREDKNSTPYLEVNIELKKRSGDDDYLRLGLEKIIHERLLAEGSEYRQVFEMKGKDFILPKVIFHKYESEEYFKPGVKQKWVKKTK